MPRECDEVPFSGVIFPIKSKPVKQCIHLLKQFLDFVDYIDTSLAIVDHLYDLEDIIK